MSVHTRATHRREQNISELSELKKRPSGPSSCGADSLQKFYEKWSPSKAWRHWATPRARKATRHTSILPSASLFLVSLWMLISISALIAQIWVDVSRHIQRYGNFTINTKGDMPAPLSAYAFTHFLLLTRVNIWRIKAMSAALRWQINATSSCSRSMKVENLS